MGLVTQRMRHYIPRSRLSEKWDSLELAIVVYKPESSDSEAPRSLCLDSSFVGHLGSPLGDAVSACSGKSCDVENRRSSHSDSAASSWRLWDTTSREIQI